MKISAVVSLAGLATAATAKYLAPSGDKSTKFHLVITGSEDSDTFVAYPTVNAKQSNPIIVGYQYGSPTWSYNPDNGQLVATIKGRQYALKITDKKWRDTEYNSLAVVAGTTTGSPVQFVGASGGASSSQDYLATVNGGSFALCNPEKGDAAWVWKSKAAEEDERCEAARLKAFYLGK